MAAAAVAAAAVAAAAARPAAALEAARAALAEAALAVDQAETRAVVPVASAGVHPAAAATSTTTFPSKVYPGAQGWFPLPLDA